MSRHPGFTGCGWGDTLAGLDLDELIQLSDIQLAQRIEQDPVVIGAMAVLDKRLFGCGVDIDEPQEDDSSVGASRGEDIRLTRVRNGQKWLQADAKEERARHWTNFAQKLRQTISRQGVAPVDIDKTQPLLPQGIPFVYDSEDVAISVKVPVRSAVRQYEVLDPTSMKRKRGPRKISPTAWVIERRPLTRDASITSDFARLIPTYIALQRRRVQYDRAVTRHQEQPERIEQVPLPGLSGDGMMRNGPKSTLVGSTGVAATVPGLPLDLVANGDGAAGANSMLDAAGLLNVMLRYGMPPASSSRELAQQLSDLQTMALKPVSTMCEGTEQFVVTRPGFRFASSPALRPLPDLAAMEEEWEEAVAMVVGVPRVFFTQKRAMFSADLKQATAALDQTVMQWNHFLIEEMTRTWARMFPRHEAETRLRYNRSTVFRLPSVVPLDSLLFAQQHRILEPQEFAERAARLLHIDLPRPIKRRRVEPILPEEANQSRA
jgi:hypothetical protein